MDAVTGTILLILAALGGWWLIGRARALPRLRRAQAEAVPAAVDEPGEDDGVARYLRLAREAARDGDDLDTLRQNERFRTAVAELSAAEMPADVAMTLARNQQFAVSALGLTALA